MPKLRYVRGGDLERLPELQDSMFKDRAAQFVERLHWPALTVDARGWERDEYDVLNPLYVILELDDGTHGASMRLLPMDGPNMIHDHFEHVVPRHSHRSGSLWECSRFIISQNADSTAAAALFVAAGELLRRNLAGAFVGLFDRRMVRIYKRMKNVPEIVGVAGEEEDWIAAGIWKMSTLVWNRSIARSGITGYQSERWYQDSLKFSSEKLVAEATTNQLPPEVRQEVMPATVLNGAGLW